MAAIVPRLAVLLHERGTITAAYVDKGDVFARTFIAHGTYGFIPGRPSAYTQPLYGWFLIPLYWIFARSWVVVGLAQIAVAVVTALLVYEIGRRSISPLAGLLGALAATLHPYLVWHDVHMNREILDELLAAAIVLLTLHLLDRRSLPLALALGAVLGLAILGNVRLVLLPLVVAAFLVAARRPAIVVVTLLACAVVVAPWVVRNRVSVGCTTLTTDGRALWKANNPNTLRTLEHGKWIDDVPPIPGAPPTPQDAGAIYASTGRIVPTNECAQMRYYRHLAVDFIGEARRCRSAHAVAAVGHAHRGPPRRRDEPRRRPPRRRARVHDRPVRARPRRPALRAAPVRGARARPPRLRHPGGDALRGRDALPRPVGLPHRAVRGGRGHSTRSTSPDRGGRTSTSSPGPRYTSRAPGSARSARSSERSVRGSSVSTP